MKEIEWVNDNKMLFESGHKTFNKQTKLITTGNHLGNTQYSLFVRSFEETECNGHENEKGELQKWDLDNFKDLPIDIREEIEALLKNRGGILNEFRYWKGDKKILVGYILTDTEHNFIESWNVLKTTKSYGILDECKKYIVN